MRLALIIALSLSVSTVPAVAQAPVIQAHFQPTRNILVGQPVRLVVTVYAPNYFTGEPDFPEFEIENAVVVLPQDRPEHSNTQIGGISYAGISVTYTIYPQQPGDFHLPKAQIAVPYAVAPPKSTTTQAALPPLSFHADVPAAARDLDYFLPTTGLTMRQTWSSPLTNLHVGDSIERTITVTASHLQGMLIPPLPFDAAAGLRIYPSEPVVRDQKTPRGDFTAGARTQTAKYLIEKEGDYTLPPIELKWWNLSANRLVTATLPPVHFTAAANPNATTELPPEPEPTPVTPARPVNRWKRYRSLILTSTKLALGLAFLSWILWRYLPRIARNLRLWQERRLHSEAAAFSRLQHACSQNDPPQSYSLLLKWAALAYPNLSLEEILIRAHQPNLKAEVEKLCAAVFSPHQEHSSWRGQTLSSLLKQERKVLAKHSANRTILNGLNPTS